MARPPLHLLLTLVLVLVAGCYSPPAANSLVGKPEATVLAELGKPWTEEPGHFAAPPIDWTKQFTGDIKTATFRKRGGELYISFEKRDGIWYVITNAWLPEGAAF
jgi:hypothetical protein